MTEIDERREELMRFHASDYTAKGGAGRPMRGVLRIGNEGTERKGWTVMAA